MAALKEQQAVTTTKMTTTKFQCEFLYKGHGYESSLASQDEDDEFRSFGEPSNEEYDFFYTGRPCQILVSQSNRMSSRGDDDNNDISFDYDAHDAN